MWIYDQSLILTTKKTERVIAICLRSTPRVATIRIVLELRRRPGQGLGQRLALAFDLCQLVFHCWQRRRCVLYTNGKETPSLLSIYSGKILWFLAGAERKGLWWRFWQIGRLDLASAVGDVVGGGLCLERVASVSPPSQYSDTSNFVFVIHIRINFFFHSP